MILMMGQLILISLSLLLSGLACAAPNHFSIVIGSALVCNDQVSADYFNGYMERFFGAPAFSAGGANWWKVNENIFNSSSDYVFVGVGRDFIGATFKDSPDKLIANVRSVMGIEYKQMGAERWRAPSSGVLIKYYDKKTPSKMYCIGSPSKAY
ncbi:MAG: hypothetical protein A3F73_03185 [Gallionellales bacterium RIFCSPLOWO2_12_FULL_59_22]|nr:MAG: hypothetical protein A3H99_06490 [Gallionellales bacterium RIFCSPLOWO2_02_FULL_59_110]OGT05538.1 MAG: hypothetical protein A2Z65_12915 [Gallionellales bacterium RIFCSPLOWO2_02_58_13]OGT13129.1 MAG: hypothetical protein A3F73_03185 [Gallionellales bacterium RIFCSPLOWO2_12_FULL_59_22]